VTRIHYCDFLRLAFCYFCTSIPNKLLISFILTTLFGHQIEYYFVRNIRWHLLCSKNIGGNKLVSSCMSLRATSPDRERSDERFSVTPCAKMLIVRSRALAVFSDVGFFSHSTRPASHRQRGIILKPRAPAHAFGPNTLATYTRHNA
jgi:hypothetical protein